jgi:hypothetical protein
MAKAVTNVNMLPGEIDGRVLAQYLGGKGQGKHYYRGLSSHYPYKVVYGEYVYADPKDVKESGSSSPSLLMRVVKQDTVKVPQKAAAPVAEAPATPAVVPAVVSEKAVVKSAPIRKPKLNVTRKAK